MNCKDKEVLLFVSETLRQIRLLAEDGGGTGAMELIRALADSAQNLPEIIAEGAAADLHFLVNVSLIEGQSVKDRVREHLSSCCDDNALARFTFRRVLDNIKTRLKSKGYFA